MGSLLMLSTAGVVVTVLASYRDLSRDESERVGLLEMSCGLGKDGEEERTVNISTPGVEGDNDKFRLVMDNERGDIMTLYRAVLVFLGMVPVLAVPDTLLLVSATMIEDMVWETVLVAALIFPAVEVFMAWVAELVAMLLPIALETQ